MRADSPVNAPPSSSGCISTGRSSQASNGLLSRSHPSGAFESGSSSSPGTSIHVGRTLYAAYRWYPPPPPSASSSLLLLLMNRKRTAAAFTSQMHCRLKSRMRTSVSRSSCDARIQSGTSNSSRRWYGTTRSSR